ncbi:hypothetical protein G6M89_20935 [Natronolimnobius sp. AArcel1]|uniref:homing endonuclease associated repeat-containing protein n=1 Tax=Natronolimnobius sp. AArcel1 TaxID=1679093 RepID=UPI0013EA6137|nr:hypothetical protein [Natronolimnobius sp. AArcel1]NGM71427.1 hypothetical protein [Natronolimnobius sp. AArcel1]
MPQKIPREDLLAELRRLANDLDRSPTTTEMNEHGKYSALTYNKRFGSWSEALDEVNLKASRKRRVTDEELLEELNRLADDLGRIPAANEMVSDGEFHNRTYTDRFGSWDEALDAAGLEASGEGYIPKETLLGELNRLAETLGRTPTTTDMNEHGAHSIGTYRKRFGSWDDALDEAGIEYPTHTRSN